MDLVCVLKKRRAVFLLYLHPLYTTCDSAIRKCILFSIMIIIPLTPTQYILTCQNSAVDLYTEVRLSFIQLSSSNATTCSTKFKYTIINFSIDNFYLILLLSLLLLLCIMIIFAVILFLIILYWLRSRGRSSRIGCIRIRLS